MAIKKWHIGKLVLLWVWGLIFVAVAWSTLEGGHVFWLVGYGLMVGIVAVPAGLSVVTWKWLTGQEERNLKEKRRPHHGVPQ